MPIAFPFYEVQANQDRYRENVAGLNQYELISPNNALLPFQIEMPADKPHPTSWSVFRLTSDGGFISQQAISLGQSYNKIKIYEFGDRKVATYNGEPLTAKPFGQASGALNLSCGHYFTRIRFADGSAYYSEVFFVPENAFTVGSPNEFIKVEFWNETDIKPVLYRDNFRQTIYLNTFVASYVPEIEEETEKDGFNNKIPVFQKLVLRYKIVDVVPDFLKIALISLQMHDHVVITTASRSGEIDRLEVTAQPHEGQGINDIEILFEDDMLYKTNCQTNDVANSVTTW